MPESDTTTRSHTPPSHTSRVVTHSPLLHIVDCEMPSAASEVTSDVSHTPPWHVSLVVTHTPLLHTVDCVMLSDLISDVAVGLGLTGVVPLLGEDVVTVPEAAAAGGAGGGIGVGVGLSACPYKSASLYTHQNEWCMEWSWPSVP